MHAALLQLRNFVDASRSLPEEDWQAFARLWQPFEAKRKAILTAPGAAERYLYFVLDGVQRVYYADADGREATLVFTYSPSFGGVLDAMLEQKASSYYYETLTASKFLRAPYAALSDLQRSSSAVEGFIFRSLSATISGLLMRMAQLQCFSSEEKFSALFSRSPQLLQLVPHKYLANYLGIDASNFSKFMNRNLI